MAFGLLGSMVAGMGAGMGKGIAEDGNALRERRFREMEMQFRAGEAQKDRAFRAGESAADRGFRSGEAEKDRGFRREMQDDEQGFRSGESQRDRDFRAGESAADRGTRVSEAQKDRDFRSSESEKERTARTGLLSNSQQFEDDQGNLWIRTPEGTRPVTAPDGTQLKGRDKEFSDGAAMRAATDPMTGEFDANKYREIRRAQAEAKRGVAAAPAETAGGNAGTSATRKPPAGYPSAKWSDKAGGWVIQKDGKWYKVEE